LKTVVLIWLFAFSAAQFGGAYRQETNAFETDYQGTFISKPKHSLVCKCKVNRLDSDDLIKAEKRINYFRSLCRLAPIELDSTMNRFASEAALIISRNKRLSHHVDEQWKCNSTEGMEGCSKSNLRLLGPLDLTEKGIDIVSGFIKDYGTQNESAGHRRWLLYSRAKKMGYGLEYNSEAVFVIEDLFEPPYRDSVPEFIAYPPSGEIPQELFYPKWSFGIPDVFKSDLSGAKISVRNTTANKILRVKIIDIIHTSNDPTIVWTVSTLYEKKPTGRTMIKEEFIGNAFEVNISGIEVDGTPRSFTYRTIAVW
jgi:hypothetical protein